MNQAISVWRVVSLLLWLYLPFAVVGYFLNLFFELSLAYCIGVLAYNYHEFIKLSHWLWNQRGIYPPQSYGLWSSIFEGIYTQQRRYIKKRNELSALVRRFRLGAESMPDAVVLFDEGRHIVWCNQLAQQMLALKWPTDKGNRLDNLIRLPEFIDYLDDKNYQTPFELVSPSNEQQILEVRVVPFEEEKWTLVVRDITQLHQLEQMRKDFIANVSHELKTPLTVMRGYLEMTPDKDAIDGAMWNRAHSMMLGQATRMEDLVGQLLSLSKLETEKTDFEPELVDVPALLNLLCEEAKSLSEDKHVIVADIDQDVSILGKESELRSAFSNLVFNAVRYTPEQGKIAIKWYKTRSGKAKFSVTDSGVGIEQSHIPRLTERFYRVDEARARQTGGAGLGLSIVKHALSHHQSKLEITSEVGVGSCFSFQFPKELVIENKLEKSLVNG